MAPDQDPEPGTGAAAGLLAELQGEPIERHDVVAGDDAFVLHTEDLVEIYGAHCLEGRGGVSRGAAELGIEGPEEVVPQIAIGGGDGSDAGDPQLVHEATAWCGSSS